MRTLRHHNCAFQSKLKIGFISFLFRYYGSDATLLIMSMIYKIPDAVLWPLLDVRLMVRVEVHQTGPRRRLVFTLGSLGQSWLGKCFYRSKQSHCIYIAISVGTYFYRKLIVPIKDLKGLKLMQKVLNSWH